MLDNGVDRSIMDEYGVTLLHDQGGSPKDGIWIFNEYPDFYVYMDSNGQYRSGLDGDDSVHDELRDALDHVRDEFYEEFGDEVSQLSWRDIYDDQDEFVAAIYHLAYGDSGFTRVASHQPDDDFWISNYTPTAVITKSGQKQYTLLSDDNETTHGSLNEAMAVANRYNREYKAASSPPDIRKVRSYTIPKDDVIPRISIDQKVGIPSMDIIMRRGEKLSSPEELFAPDSRGGRMIRSRRRVGGNGGGQVNVEFK